MSTAQLIDLTTPVRDPKAGTNISHLKWSRVIARAVRERYHFGKGSQEEQDLEQTASLELVRKLPDFDHDRVPANGNSDMAFRGWVKDFIYGACQREALRLRNGGTYHTTRTPPRPVSEFPDDMADDRPSAAFEIGEVLCRLSGIHLTVESEPDLHTWAVAVGVLEIRRERATWHLGDLALYGVERFGHDAWDKLGAMYASKTIQKAALVSRRFAPEIRISGASWSHHVVVSGLELSRALAMLRRAVREKLSRRQLKELVTPTKPRKPSSVLSRAESRRLPEVAARHGIDPVVVLAVLKELRPASE